MWFYPEESKEMIKAAEESQNEALEESAKAQSEVYEAFKKGIWKPDDWFPW